MHRTFKIAVLELIWVRPMLAIVAPGLALDIHSGILPYFHLCKGGLFESSCSITSGRNAAFNSKHLVRPGRTCWAAVDVARLVWKLETTFFHAKAAAVNGSVRGSMVLCKIESAVS